MAASGNLARLASGGAAARGTAPPCGWRRPPSALTPASGSCWRGHVAHKKAATSSGEITSYRHSHFFFFFFSHMEVEIASAKMCFLTSSESSS